MIARIFHERGMNVAEENILYENGCIGRCTPTFLSCFPHILFHFGFFRFELAVEIGQNFHSLRSLSFLLSPTIPIDLSKLIISSSAELIRPRAIALMVSELV